MHDRIGEAQAIVLGEDRAEPGVRIAMKRLRGRQLGAAAGFFIAGTGLVIIVLHTIEAAFTQHIWLLVGQGVFFGGGFLGLALLWGSPRRRRR